MHFRRFSRHPVLLAGIALMVTLASHTPAAEPAFRNPKRSDFEPQTPLAELERQLKSDAAKIRAHAALELACLHSDSEKLAARRMIPRLVELLDDDSARVREQALIAIPNLGGPRAKAAVPKMASLAKDKDAMVRAMVLIGGIGKMTPEDAQPGIADVVRLIADPDGLVRYGARETLPLLPGKGLDAQTPYLLDLVKTADPEIASIAAMVLAVSTRSEKSEALPRMIELLRDDSELVQCNVAMAVAGFGDPALPALSQLIRMTEGPGTNAAKLMLGSVELDEGPYAIRREVVKAIAELAPLAPKTSLPALTKQLAFESPGYATGDDIRGAAARGIGRIGSPTADRAVGQIIELLKDDYRSAEPAIETLKLMDKDVLRKHRPRLIEMLSRGHQSKGPDGTKRNEKAARMLQYLDD